MRLDPEVVPLEPGMTFGTVSGIVALITGLWVVERLKGMDLPEIGSVGFGYGAGNIVRNAQIRCDAAAFVTIEAELLVMAVRAVLSGSACEEAVFPHLI